MPTASIACTKSTTRRNSVSSGSGTGCGQSKHLYVGRYGSYDYDSFVQFSIDFAGLNVAKVVSAKLNIYTDEFDTFGSFGEPGIMAQPKSADKPRMYVYRLTSSFSQGDNVDGHFDSGDYVSPSKTTSGGKSHTLTSTEKGANQLIQIDITDIVKSWAPSSVAGGGRHTNYGLMLAGTSSTSENWSGWSKVHTGSTEDPSITLVYELGPTVPNAPGGMTPSGTIASLTSFDGGFTDPRTSDTLQSTSIEIYDGGHACTTATDNFVTSAGHKLNVGDAIYFTSVTSTNLTAFHQYYVIASGFTTSKFKISTTLGGSIYDITDAGSATWSPAPTTATKVATQSERVAALFSIPRPTSFVPTVGSTYRWRARNTDQEGQTSAWTGLVSFVLSNTAPNPPVLSPISGASYTNFNLVKFQGGAFSDPDGDALMAHQVQLSSFPQGDARWDEADELLWDTGKAYDPFASTSWTDYYGGRALSAGTYYWRARHWDSRDGVSAWVYATIVLTSDFSPDPGNYDNVQINPRAPWRILIRDLYQSDGVTKTVGRAPGNLIAVFEEAKSVGTSIVYNSPGELHFTLLKDDPQIGLLEPKQVHYAVEFYSGDGWQEKFAGVIWDVDATETDVVFKGIDYLALYDTVIDERYDPLKPNKSYKNNGSFYEQVTIRNIVLDQLNWAKKLTDSWVGFISIGSIPAMEEKVTVYSTMQPVLSFVSGLIDSHRQGQGIRTRMKVVKTTTGGYQFQIVNDPGTTVRSDLAMYYGELVQGYRVIIFGDAWANVEHVIGRNKDGAKVVYKTIKGQTFQPSTSVYGRIATVAVMDGVQDQIDLNRRGLQAAIQSAKIGKHIAIGIRTEHLAPLQGWDVCDTIPLTIKDGAVDTSHFGSGIWAVMACAWEVSDIGQQSLVLTFMPREDKTSPNPDLIPSGGNASPQPEWQLGWTPPDPVKAYSKFWLDQSTGKVYIRDETTGTLTPVTGTP